MTVNDKNLCLGCMREKSGENAKCLYCGYVEGAPFLPTYLAPGTQLGERYIVGKVLDYNGEGASYIGYDTVTGARVRIREYMPESLASRDKGESLIKVIPGCETQYKALMSDFVELSKQLMRVRSLSSIVPVLDIFDANDTVYAVYEQADGILLNEFLRKNGGYISWEEAKSLFFPLLTSLSSMHNANMIHRGISPDTILLDKSGKLRLLGFSTAAARTARSELVAELFGGYAAPEQYSSSTWQGTYTDVYAIAAVIYKALTGTMPPEAMNRATNDNLIPADQLAAELPKNIANAIAAAMVLTPEKRTQTAGEFLAQLSEVLDYGEGALMAEGASSVAEGSGAEKPKKKKKKVNPAILACLITLLVLIPIGAILLIFIFDPFSSLSSSGTTSSSSNLPDDSISNTISENVRPNAELVVPDLVKKNYDWVDSVAQYKEFYTIVKIEEFNDELAKGVIIRQEPEANTPIEQGGEITVYVSKGPQFITLTESEYIGREVKYIQEKLYDLGFRVNPTIMEITDEEEIAEIEAIYGTIPEGCVAKLSCEFNIPLDLMTENITLYVKKVQETSSETSSELLPEESTSSSDIPPSPLL